MDILDANNKIITRTYTKLHFIQGDVGKEFVTNNTILATTNGGGGTLYNRTSSMKDFTITVDKTGAKFTYANYPTVSTPIFDASANWRLHKKVVVTFFNNGKAGKYRKFGWKAPVFSFSKD